MIDQFEVAIATALWRHNLVTNILISKDSDVIFINVLVILIGDDFHQYIDSFFNLY